MTREQAKRILSDLYGGHSVPGADLRRAREYADLLREIQRHATADIRTEDILVEEPVFDDSTEYHFVRRVS